MFGARRVLQEFEAKLYGAESGGRTGKVERKEYGDGEHRMRIRVRLDVAGRGSASVRIDGARVADVPLEDGSGRLDLRSEQGDAVPVVQVGQTVELVYDGRTVASGKFALD